jgi:GAF domain-containing protein
MIQWTITNALPLAISDQSEDTGLNLSIKLPDTHAHAVLPLRTRERTMGTVVIQSQNPGSIDPSKMTALQLLADQIATLLVNARIFAERETAFEIERRAYSELTRTAWKEFLHSRPLIAFQRSESGLSPITSFEEKSSKKDPEIKSTPIQVRGQLIGYIDAQKPAAAGPWTPAEINLLDTLSDRLESALDTARLYEETQQRAAQERVVSEATTRMRETLDIETILQTAAQELRSALNLAEVEVRMGLQDGENPDEISDQAEG